MPEAPPVGVCKPQKKNKTAGQILRDIHRAVKKGEQNEMMKKYGITIAHVKEVDRTIARIDEQYHREHLGLGKDYEKTCTVCQKSKGEIEQPEEPEDLDDDIPPPENGVQVEEKSEKPTMVKKPTKKKVKPKEKSEPQQDDELEIIIEDKGKQSKTTLEQLKKSKGKTTQKSLFELTGKSKNDRRKRV